MVISCVERSQSQQCGLTPYRKSHLKNYPLLLVNVACSNVLRVTVEVDDEVQRDDHFECPTQQGVSVTSTNSSNEPQRRCIRFSCMKTKVIATILKVCQEKIKFIGDETKKDDFRKNIDALKKLWTTPDKNALTAGSSSLRAAYDRSDALQFYNKLGWFLQLNSKLISDEPIDKRYNVMASIDDNFRRRVEHLIKDKVSFENKVDTLIEEWMLKPPAAEAMHAFVDNPSPAAYHDALSKVIGDSNPEATLKVTVKVEPEILLAKPDPPRRSGLKWAPVSGGRPDNSWISL